MTDPRPTPARPLTPLALGLALLGSALAQPTLKDGVLSGTITDWPTGKTGTLFLGIGSDPDLADAPVAADGTFTLTLPDPAAFNNRLGTTTKLFTTPSSYNEGCTGTGTATPDTGTFQQFVFKVSVDGQTPTFIGLNDNPRSPVPLGQAFAVLSYFGTATTLHGTVSCPGEGWVDTYNGTFPAGWSFASGTVTNLNADKSLSESFTPNALPAAVAFQLSTLYIGVGLSLDAAPSTGAGFPVNGVSLGKPADLAGLKVSDMVVQVDGQDVTVLSRDQVLDLIRGGTEGSKVTLGVQRGGNATIIPITITRALIKTP